MWDGTHKSVVPTNFMEVEYISSRFSGKTEVDAQDFITFLLDELSKDLDKLVEQNSDVFHEAKMAEKVNNPVTSLFRGQMRWTWKCHKKSCQHMIQSTRLNYFTHLTLPIPDGLHVHSPTDQVCMYKVTSRMPKKDNAFTVEYCFKMKTKMDNESKRKCVECQTVPCHLEVDIVTQPEILLLYIDRFCTLNHRHRRKVNTHVKFPIKGLDLSQFSSTPSKPCYYDLYATINHTGNADAGQYTVYVRNEGKWYFIDDNKIRLLQDTNEVTDLVQLSTVYVLFYEKRVKTSGHDLRKKLPDLKLLPTKGLVNHCKIKGNTEFSGLCKPIATLEQCRDIEIKPSDVEHSNDQSFKHSEDASFDDEQMDTTPLELPTKNDKMCDAYSDPDHDPRDLRLCGLAKLDNNGYVNATLQCLSSITALKNYFIGHSSSQCYVQDVNKSSLRERSGKLTKCFAELLRSMRMVDEVLSNQKKFMKNLEQLAPRFTGGIHQDSQIFLAYMLDGLHEDVKITVGQLTKKLEDECDELEKTEDNEAFKSWVEFLMNNNSKVVELFQVQLRSLQKCGDRECCLESVTYDFFRCLTLPIPNVDKSCTLEDCFELVMQTTTNSEPSFCQKCYTSTIMEEKLQISRAPRFLIIYLKRFTDGFTNKSKFPLPITFPIKKLDLSPYLCDSGKRCHYGLQATIHHIGNASRGHYIAFARRRNKWYMFDDEQFTEVEQPNPKVDTNQASTVYVLFYKKKSRITPHQVGQPQSGKVEQHAQEINDDTYFGALADIGDPRMETDEIKDDDYDYQIYGEEQMNTESAHDTIGASADGIRTEI